MTREEIIFKIPSKHAVNVAKSIDKLERKYKAEFKDKFKTITFDNGGEFRDYKALEKSYEAISVVKNFNNKEYLFDIYIYINQIRKTLNQFDLALNILDKAKKLNLKNEILLFHLYSRYADTYCELNNIELSNEYFLKAQEFSKFINDSF